MGQTHSRQQLEDFLTSRILSPISPRPSTNVLAKSKYYKNIKFFAQATKGSIKDILKIKEAFSKLLTIKLSKCTMLHTIPIRKYVLRSA